MTDISDEILMAHADGQLTKQESAAIDAILEKRPDLRARRQMFVDTRVRLTQLYSTPDVMTVPNRVIATIDATLSAHKSRTSSSSAFRSLERAHRELPSVSLPVTLLSALCLGIAGLATGSAIENSRRATSIGDNFFIVSAGQIRASGPLREHLEKAHTGQAVSSLIDGKSVRTAVLATFKSKSGDFCREYEIAGASGSRSNGVSCRDQSGDWRIEAVARTESLDAGSGGMRPAGRSSSVLVEELVDKIIDGDVFGSVQETRAIARGWSKD